MVFKSEKELKSFLLKKCEIALIKAQEEVYRVIDKFIRDYYDDYDPVRYERTYQLFNSFVMSDIIPNGNGYKVCVYFDIDGLRYFDGNQPTGKQVMGAAAQGLHGAIGGRFFTFFGENGIDIWNTPSKIIDTEAINMLEQELIGQGIPIKKV